MMNEKKKNYAPLVALASFFVLLMGVISVVFEEGNNGLGLLYLSFIFVPIFLSSLVVAAMRRPLASGINSSTTNNKSSTVIKILLYVVLMIFLLYGGILFYQTLIQW